MLRKKKFYLPFDSRGGVLRIQRVLLNSEVFLKLPAQAKVLMFLMQEHWRNDKAVDYGVREAMGRIPCAKGTAAKAFKALEKNGFIVMMDESRFSSRTQSKSRTWRLTWLPWMANDPTNDWEKNR